MNFTDNRPYEFIVNSDFKSLHRLNHKIVHRFFDHDDFVGLILTLKFIYDNYSSLQNFFNLFYSNSTDLRMAISKFSKEFNSILSSSIFRKELKKNLIPTPENGSPCKRINLFLRWMVRNDEVDFGIWNNIHTSELIIPLDTHIYKVARVFNLTTLKSPSWRMAEEITKNLKLFDRNDPVKYDFALSHINVIDFK